MGNALIMHTLPAELVQIAERIRSAIKVTAGSIVDIGKDLTDAKRMVHHHGAWLSWLDTEFQMSARTAQRYMRAAEFAKGKYDTVSLLPPATIYLLSAPSTPERIKAEVIAALTAKQPVDHQTVESKIKEARQAVRRDLESRSEIPNVAAAKDTRGRNKPAKKVKPAAVIPIVPPAPRPSPTPEHALYTNARPLIAAAIVRLVDDGWPGLSVFTAIDALLDAQRAFKERCPK